MPSGLIAAIGCRRGTGAGEIISLIDVCLAEAGCGRADLAALATVAEKCVEPGLQDAARQLTVPLLGLPVAVLAAQRSRLSAESLRVEARFGVPAIAEAVALALGEMVVGKRRSPAVTCALGTTTAGRLAALAVGAPAAPAPHAADIGARDAG